MSLPEQYLLCGSEISEFSAVIVKQKEIYDNLLRLKENKMKLAQ
jgi:hypothetical protein